jgi:hypothetical protein
MWNKIIDIVEWFGEINERRGVVKDFNNAAKKAFISGDAPTLLNAKTTLGEPEYHHHLSKFLSSGFKIKAISGRELSKDEMKEIGAIVLDNKDFVRKLITMGWDTLYVFSDGGDNGLKWSLMEVVKTLYIGKR